MKLEVGDIFEFSINENTKSYGQIIRVPNKKSITVIIFEDTYRSRPDLEEILKGNILLFGNTFDAKFYHNQWIIFDNEKSHLNNIELPYYKVGTNPVYIEDFEKSKIREAKPNEIDQLFYRSYVAPVRFESALKAYYKSLEWKDKYDELLYSNILKNRELVS